MANAETDKSTRQKPLRLWPGVVAVVLLWLARFGLKMVMPGFEGFELGIMGGFVGALAVIVWWAFFSRAPHFERWGAIVLMIVAMLATWQIKHESMGPFWVAAYAVPVLCLAFVAWLVAVKRGYPSEPFPGLSSLAVSFIVALPGLFTAISFGRPFGGEPRR